MRYCGRCHTCGTPLKKVLDGEEWCPTCQAYRRYASHGWNARGDGELECPTEDSRKMFPKGTVARCNRCHKTFTTPRPTMGVRENSQSWRLLEMMMAGCGHVDSHWVYESDQAVPAEQ